MRLKTKNNSICNIISFSNMLRALNFIALFIFTINSLLYSQILQNIESNFLKIDSNILYDESKSDSLISFINENEIDDILLHIYSNGEARYNSNLLYSEIDSIRFDDPLKLFLNKIDTMNINIHAWIDVYNLWSKNYYPENQNHFYYQCPECLESDINGRSDDNINLDQIQSLEWEGVYLSPLHPIVNNYILSIIDEIISKYEFDGIFLDYLRYQDYYYGYNTEGIEAFESAYNINPQDINRGIISRRYGYSITEIDSISKLWNQFKTDKITELVKAISESVKFKNLDLGVSVMSDPVESKSRWFQDWGLWLNQNIIDYVAINYSDSNFIDFNYLLRKINNHINYNDKKKISFEMSTSNSNTFDISNKIISLRLNGYEKLGINYNFIKDTLNWYVPIYDNINFKLYK